MRHTFCEPAGSARVTMIELSFRPDMPRPGWPLYCFSRYRISWIDTRRSVNIRYSSLSI